MLYSKLTSAVHGPDVSQVLAAISIQHSLLIIKFLESTTTQHDSQDIMDDLMLSKKQLYTTIARLSNVGIVKRNTGIYHLTTFGKLISNSIRLVENSVGVYSKLKAVDAIGDGKAISTEEIVKLIDVLIDDERIREIVKLSYSL